jgi:hypothetical protein
MTLYAKRKAGFHNMRPERARALSCRGTRTVVELANDYAHTYAPFIRAAVREVGHNYRQVAIDSPGLVDSRRETYSLVQGALRCRS